MRLTILKKPSIQRWAICLLAFCVVNTVYGQETSYSNVESRSLAYVDSAKVYSQIDLNTALVYADSAYALVPQIENEAIKVMVISNVGDIYLEIADMDNALKYFLEAKGRLNEAQIEYPENAELILLEVDVLIKIGAQNFHFGSFEKSLTFYEEALRKLEQSIALISLEEAAEKKIRLFNNIAGIHIHNADYETALAYYQNALDINKAIGNKGYESSMESNIGICYMEKGEHDLANHHFLKALSLRKELNNTRGQAQTLNSIGKNQAMKGNFELAKSYFEQALELGKQIGNGKSILISLESLYLTYDTLGEYKKALKTLSSFKALNDSIYSTESRTSIAKLEESFRRDKEKKAYEIAVEREKSKLQSAELSNLKIGAALLSLLLLASLIIVYMRGKIRTGKLHQEKLELEHANLALERTALQESLDYKERELTANALFLIQNNELISKITEKLLEAQSTFKQENQKVIQDIIIELRAGQNKNLWEEFEAHFTHVHSDFYQKLQEQFPNLTANERKLCAFLRLNMSTKDISAITYQSVNSITVARSRLRKKLNIEGEDIHLDNFLMSF